MTRITLVVLSTGLFSIGLAGLAGPVRSDPSPETRVPSTTAPSISVPSTASPASPAPIIAPPDTGAVAPTVVRPSVPAIAAPTPAAKPAQSAQDTATPGAEDGGRYSFHRMGDGFVRLDTRTGQLTQCGWAATGWSCKAVPDERAALESEIARLQRENGALKKSLLSRGIALPGGAIAEAPAAPPVPPAAVPDPKRDDNVQGPKPPSEADLDRAVAYMKGVWRKLVDMMLDLQRDIQRKS